MQRETYRDLQRLTEADRDNQRDAGSCIEMHRPTDTGRDRQRQTETDKDSQRQAATGRYRQIHAATEPPTSMHKGRDRDSRRGHVRGIYIYRQCLTSSDKVRLMHRDV